MEKIQSDGARGGGEGLPSGTVSEGNGALALEEIGARVRLFGAGCSAKC